MTTPPAPNSPPELTYYEADAATPPLATNSVDTIITSPPYWQQRDYEVNGQLGQEDTPEAFADTIVEYLNGWKECLAPHGTVLLNVDDTYRDTSLQGIPAAIATRARTHGWRVLAQVTWHKPHCKPTAAGNRLKRTHEPLFVLTEANGTAPYIDRVGFLSAYPTDDPTVWSIPPASGKDHAAPFPDGLARRGIHLLAPETACTKCGVPVGREFPETWPGEIEETLTRIRRLDTLIEHDAEDDVPVDLSEALSRAKTRLKTAIADHSSWDHCDCDAGTAPGTVYDPYVGSGTTAKVAVNEGRSGIGSDLAPPDHDPVSATLSSY